MPFDTLALARMSLRMAPDAKVVSIGASSTHGVLNDAEDIGFDESGRPVTQRDRTVFVVRDSLAGAIDGATITIGGTAYTVRNNPMPRENGDLWAIMVAKVDS